MNNWVRATTKAEHSSLTLAVPKGASRVSVLGAVDMDHSSFAVSFSASVMGVPSFNLSAWSQYTVQNFSIFDAALDTASEHRMTITNKAPTGAYLDISQVVFYKPVGSGSGLSKGAIIGIAVGCAVGGMVVLTLLAWALWRQWKRKSTHTGTGMDLESDHEHAHVEPFHDGRPMSSLPTPAASLPITLPTSPPSSAPSSLPSGAALPAAYAPLGTGSSSSASDHFSSARYSLPLTVHNPDEFGAGPSSPLDSKTPAAPVLVQHVHHTDGGAMPAMPSVVVEETPPSYDPNWAPGASGSGASGSVAVTMRPEKS